MDDVTDKLLRDGIDAFVTPFEKLMAGIESSREAAIEGRPSTIEASGPDDLLQAVAEKVDEAISEKVAARVWRKDETLWGGPGPEIGNRLGWLTISESMLEAAPGLKEFAAQVKAEGFTDAALLGMGGSSLGPEVLRRSFERLHRRAEAARARLDRRRGRA